MAKKRNKNHVSLEGSEPSLYPLKCPLLPDEGTEGQRGERAQIHRTTEIQNGS